MGEAAQAAAVLDASALIALIKDEPGADAVSEVAGKAALSTVNWAEVLEVLASLGLPIHQRRDQIERLGVTLVPLSSGQAEAAAAMRTATREAGLSLADRACLALARDLGIPALTADRAWREVDVGVEVQLLR